MRWKSQLSFHIKDVSFTMIYLREVGNCINSNLSTGGYSHCPLNKIKHLDRALASKLMLQVNIAKYFFGRALSLDLHRRKGFGWVWGEMCNFSYSRITQKKIRVVEVFMGHIPHTHQDLTFKSSLVNFAA